MPRKRILVADPDAVFRTSLGGALRAAGYDPMLASDGEAAFEAAAAAADRGTFPDALVVDFRLPRLSGLGVVHSLRHLAFRPAVVLLSGFLDPSVELVARRAGIDRVLFKPVEAQVVIAMLGDSLR